MTNHIEGKSIIITGAGSGFGQLISLKAAQRGARITCADINGEAAKACAAEIMSEGGQAQAVTADVSDIAQMKVLASQAVRTYGSIDVMVNNAGIMPLASSTPKRLSVLSGRTRQLIWRQWAR